MKHKRFDRLDLKERKDAQLVHHALEKQGPSGLRPSEITARTHLEQYYVLRLLFYMPIRVVGTRPPFSYALKSNAPLPELLATPVTTLDPH